MKKSNKNKYYHKHFHKGQNIIYLEDRDETHPDLSGEARM